MKGRFFTSVEHTSFAGQSPVSEDTRKRVHANLRKGFSLIELLVVIAIIAILAAILFPLLNTARATARTANCQSNIKQIGIAMDLYSESWDGRLPNYHNFLQGEDRRMWWDFIMPFLKAGKIYRCPALLNSKGQKITNFGLYNRVYGYGVSHPHIFNSAEKKSPKTSAIPRPSKTMLMCDSYTMAPDVDTGVLIECGYPALYCRVTKGATGHNTKYSGQMPDGNVGGRHGGSSNVHPYGKAVVLFCDLHVSTLPKEYLIKEYETPSESGNADIWGHFDNIQK